MIKMNQRGTALFCVKCAAQTLSPKDQKSYACSECGFVYFHNVASAVCAVITCQDQILLVRRGAEPSLGKLDFPGGFVDYAESNEQALTRELMEELKLPVSQMRYLFSIPNSYLYKNVEYPTLDTFFSIQLETMPDLTIQASEIAGYQWSSIETVAPDDMAFASGQNALEQLKAVDRK